MANPNDNMEDAMMDIINTGTATQYADGDDHNQDVDGWSQYLALENEQENTVQYKAGEVYLIIYHLLCIHEIKNNSIHINIFI
jgi:hypothetical protein